MTLLHDALPLTESAPPTEEIETWQTAHEPILAMRVWLDKDYRAMVSMRWAQEVLAEPDETQPLIEMSVAALHINQCMVRVLTVLAKEIVPIADVLEGKGN